MSITTHRRLLPAFGLVAAGAACAALTSCGSGGSTTATSPDSTTMSSMSMDDPSSMDPQSSHMAGMKGMVMIDHFAFTSPKSVEPDATVMVMNTDSETHSVTADDDAFDVTVPPGRTAEITAPDKPGSYAFHCRFHGTMTGTLRVR